MSGVSRQPRLRVLADGVPVAGAREAEVVATSHFAADRFTVSLALGADPLWTAAMWSAEPDVLLDVQMGFLTAGAPEGLADWVSLVQGAVDSVEIDAVGGLVRLDGRDLSAALIEARTQETFANRTASEIAQILAERHNLAADVAPTETPVGRYYELEHDRITLNQFSRATTEWDLLVWLAEREGFDVWVEGTTLHFRPGFASGLPDAVLRPVDMAGGPANLMGLRLERSLTLAGDIEVTVKSWNARQQAAFEHSARSRTRSKGLPRRYVFVRPNLTADDALKLAQRKLAELTRHERVISASMPGELSLSPRSAVLLEGTGTAFDQIYYMDTIERHLRFDGGFTQHIRARNGSASDESTPPGDLVLGVTG